MENANSAEARYTRVAIAFHWIIAALIVLNFALIWSADDASEAVEQQIKGYHFAVGLLILMLTVLRIIWRLMNPAPPYVDTLQAWEVALAKVVNALFYFLMIAIPLTGWAMVSAASGGHSIGFFGLFEFPGLPFSKDRGTAGVFHEVHEVFAIGMLVLFALHVAAALKHRVIDRDGTMQRMLPR